MSDPKSAKNLNTPIGILPKLRAYLEEHNLWAGYGNDIEALFAAHETASVPAVEAGEVLSDYDAAMGREYHGTDVAPPREVEALGTDAGWDGFAARVEGARDHAEQRLAEHEAKSAVPSYTVDGESKPTGYRDLDTVYANLDPLRQSTEAGSAEALAIAGARGAIREFAKLRDAAYVACVEDDCKSEGVYGAMCSPHDKCRRRPSVLRPVDDWHEDEGAALFWADGEPPYSGTPIDTDWPGDDYGWLGWTPMPPWPGSIEKHAYAVDGDRS